ncbi:MAG: class I SAM-dependent methyltransferase [Saprospiraceae bacterium]|nr:class I SAM-dependent methyltransferase [Saprospiraceae bacterium]MBK9631223.1 class I SAM-dependent methyltransferase [Saprospiraceae bacterium]
MDEQTLKEIAKQLRQPSGEFATQVGQKMNEGNLHINLNTIEALNLQKGDHILEIGMGNGFFVKNILSTDHSIKYTGCDISEAMVAESSKQNETWIASGQAHFQLADANELPFDPSSFNKVFSINTLYFWDPPQKVLAEIWRVLKPLGQVIISIRPKSIMEHYPFVKYGFKVYSKEDLRELIENNHFKVIEIIEKDEPEVEINGELTKTATLLIRAEK